MVQLVLIVNLYYSKFSKIISPIIQDICVSDTIKWKFDCSKWVLLKVKEVGGME